MTQLLCFYGEGPFRDNLVRIPAYPSGFSYFRPFRYGDRWVEDALLADFEEKGGVERALRQDTILGIRFYTPPHEWRVIPFRRVKVVHIEAVADQHLVHFVVDRFFDFRRGSLEEISVEIPVEERERIGESLFFRSSLVIDEESFVEHEEEEAIWIRYTNLVAKSSLPFKDDSRLAVFLRFRTPLRRRPARIKRLYKSKSTGAVYGASLAEGGAYEFMYLHRTPSLVDSNVGFQRFRIHHLTHTGNLELERPDEESSAHYQPHVFQMVAFRRSGRGEDLVLRPEPTQIPTEDNRNLHTHDVVVPLKVRKSMWHRLKTRWIFLVLLVAAFIVVSAWESSQGLTDVSLWDQVPSALPSGLLGALLWYVQQQVSR